MQVAHCRMQHIQYCATSSTLTEIQRAQIAKPPPRQLGFGNPFEKSQRKIPGVSKIGS
jgi:hypothetical protein